MRNYELVCILDPQAGEGQYDQLVEKYEALLGENGGQVVRIDNWGLRRLAYTSSSLKNRHQGYYVLYQFAAEPTAIEGLEQTLKLDEVVLRYLITGVEGEFIHVPQLAADNFLEEAFARPTRGPRDRGGPHRDSRGPRDRSEAHSGVSGREAPDEEIVEKVEGVEEAEEAPEEAVVQESDDS
ncbi:MAG: 30S ribosomal protein S6 [Gemmatimonadota bacterium]|nr:30S ribosomal protein S6 [Gemmatimonadota bacterium]